MRKKALRRRAFFMPQNQAFLTRLFFGWGMLFKENFEKKALKKVAS